MVLPRAQRGRTGRRTPPAVGQRAAPGHWRGRPAPGLLRARRLLLPSFGPSSGAHRPPGRWTGRSCGSCGWGPTEVKAMDEGVFGLSCTHGPPAGGWGPAMGLGCRQGEQLAAGAGRTRTPTCSCWATHQGHTHAHTHTHTQSRTPTCSCWATHHGHTHTHHAHPHVHAGPRVTAWPCPPHPPWAGRGPRTLIGPKRTSTRARPPYSFWGRTAACRPG